MLSSLFKQFYTLFLSKKLTTLGGVATPGRVVAERDLVDTVVVIRLATINHLYTGIWSILKKGVRT